MRSRFRLTTGQREQLQRQLKTTTQVGPYRRTLALLQIDQGRPILQVAKSLRVTPGSIHNWMHRFEEQRQPEALQQRPGQGRKSKLSPAQEQSLHEVLAGRPEDQGYVGTTWTVALLRHWLKRQGGTPLSDTTLRRHLHRLGYVWKRFRYVLRPDPEFSKKKPKFSTNWLGASSPPSF